MKVCFLTATYPPNTTGGVGEVVYNLQKYLSSDGIQTCVITSGQSHRMHDNVIWIPCSKTSFVPSSAIFYLRKLRKMDFDVLNIQEESGLGVAPFLLARKKRTKIVTTLHTSYIQEARALRPLIVDEHRIASPTIDELMTKYLLMPLKFFGAYIDSAISHKVIAVCRKTMEDCRVEFGIAKNKMTVIHNGVDLEKFNPKVSGSAVREAYKLKDRPVILYVGRAEIRKGLFLLLLSMQKVISEVPSARLVIVGGHVRTASMDVFLNNLGIQDSVIFAGRVREDLLPQYYAASDLVVLPSTYEGLPLVVLEAMASAKPTVAARVGGVPEAIEDHENGILFEPGDVSAMSKGILLLLQNHSMRARMGSRGRTMAQQRFNWKVIARQYVREFEALS